MPRKVRQLKAELQRAGFQNRGGKGSHTNWVHPWLPGMRITIAGQDGDDARAYNEDAVRDALAALAAETARRKVRNQAQKGKGQQ
jgi:predicted RNA binding protein YcfA (HicA-like mRNA interferase family)